MFLCVSTCSGCTANHHEPLFLCCLSVLLCCGTYLPLLALWVRFVVSTGQPKKCTYLHYPTNLTLSTYLSGVTLPYLLCGVIKEESRYLGVLLPLPAYLLTYLLLLGTYLGTYLCPPKYLGT